MKKIASLVFFSMFASLLYWLPVSACGCGVMISQIPYTNTGWTYGDDSAEQAYINYDKGVEKLIIGLDIKASSKDSVLVIPIPATPQTVTADVLSELPQFTGYDVSKKASDNISHISLGLLETQIYPLAPIALFNFLSNALLGVSQGQSSSVPFGQINGAAGITVYQHLEKSGMIAEVLSAANSDALYNYLSEKGLKVEKDSIPIFKDYINKDFSFVVTWINPSMSNAPTQGPQLFYSSSGVPTWISVSTMNTSTSNASARGLQMSFPSSNIFYPLKPGSAYAGSGTIKNIYVVGYVSPNIYSGIKGDTKVNYYYSEGGITFDNFFSTNQGFGFTHINIFSAPKNLTQDLYMSNHAPILILIEQRINQDPLLFGVIWLILLSFLSTFFALRFAGITASSFIGLSISSCFTLIGTAIGARIFLKQKRIRFIIGFSMIFVLLLAMTTVLIANLLP